MTTEPKTAPYYIAEIQTRDYFYCTDCEKRHPRETHPKFYNVCCDLYDNGRLVEIASMPAFRTCNLENAKTSAAALNRRHYRIKELSIAQGHKPVLI